ncbi:MAG: transglycosylase SLT domain-containing protein [Actinomycetota bacterium]|nr:transglycosylase SLT domain-containing protein [Actinomycetota bacterium]
MWEASGRMGTRSVYLRRRLGALALVVIAAAALDVTLASHRDGDGRRGPAPPVTTRVLPPVDPLRYDPARRGDYERHAALGLSHVIYAKTPGGVLAGARRTERFGAIYARVAARHGLDADTLGAIVLLESAGRPDAQASSDLSSAAGLTQILAETGQNLLGLSIDVKQSERLTRGIARASRVAARTRRRMRVDERFDPAKAVEATARYLDFAKAKLGGRADLAVQSYHMGIGNLQQALVRYGKGDVPYAQLYFDSSPVRNFSAWRRLASLDDDSSTYYWRVLAAREILRLYRGDRKALADLAELHSHKASSEEVLHPEATTPPYDDGGAIDDAIDDGKLVALPAADLRAAGIRIDPRMGALAPRIDSKVARYRALRRQALAVLEAIGREVRRISRAPGSLILTSTVRDRKYQEVLAAGDVEATQAFSLHTTGWAFDLARVYRSRAQALALQFMLDRLAALGLVAWVREPRAIHVTVATT